MRKWMTPAVTVSVMSVGMVGVAMPAQAGNFLPQGPGSALQESWDSRPATERVEEARKAAQGKITNLKKQIRSGKEWVRPDSRIENTYRFMSFPSSGENLQRDEKELERYTNVVKDAEVTYVDAVTKANDTLANPTAIEITITNNALSPEVAQQSIPRFYLGYQAYLNAAAEAYIDAVNG